MVRGNLFDWRWNIRAAIVAKRLNHHIRHSWLWLIEILADVMERCPEAERPSVLRGWKRTNTEVPPIIRRGIIDEALVPARSKARSRVSVLRDANAVDMLLEHADRVAAGDTAALYRLTGVAVSDNDLKVLNVDAHRHPHGSHPHL